MNGAPQLFETFIDRDQTGLPNTILPNAIGAVVAGADLLRGVGHVGSDCPKGWSMVPSGTAFQRYSFDDKWLLEVKNFGSYWYVLRVEEILSEKIEALVIAFGHVPICTRTHQAAMRLAEHCYPVSRWPMAGCWVGIFIRDQSDDLLKFSGVQG